MVEAEPVELLEVVRRLRRAVLARPVAARPLADPLRALDRAGEPAPARPPLLVGGDGDVEVERLSGAWAGGVLGRLAQLGR